MTDTYVLAGRHRLHGAVLDLVRTWGPTDPDRIARRLRRDLRDASVDADAVRDVVAVSTVLVPLPDGRVGHSLTLLEGAVLTHRARTPLGGRTDLWVGCGLQPLLSLTAFGPLPLADGSGEVTRSEEHDVLVGPPGWLPDVGRHELVGLRVVGGALRAEAVDPAELPGPEREAEVRGLLSEIYLRHADPTYCGAADPAQLARAVSVALLVDPELFHQPLPPLEELLHNPLQRGVDVGHWRAVAVGSQVETEGFWLDGMPVALAVELRRRARCYGMDEAQFVVALLGTLAWRTPFAEDMEPWSHWLPERAPVAGVAGG
ncbi:hypothetical protein [Nocardioides sp. CFH 31398]|uniref:hypothetical protein n=1 Tax=Nocardioides sp. CFH 31398 TaxID=2919579 RepID=UPI001F057324|nr:hypothetical protein [Nocardioides sp. CFH 31398]MCH1867599.1 hypothetical protein [Nocardioides sp. CFH 31398]